MKFSTALDLILSENKFLKILSKALLLIAVSQLVLIYALYDKTPLLIERGSRGLEIVDAVEPLRTPDDVSNAIRLMLKARFDSAAIATEIFLNPKQQALRDTEQSDLKSRNMNQSVVIRSIAFEKDLAIVDIDRVIAVSDLRSALKAKIRMSFEEVSPNELNPYGLLLSVAEPMQKEQSK